jgi:hypothetical protein
MRDIAANDVIVDLCGTQAVTSPNNLTKASFRSPGESEAINPLKNTTPDPSYSWMEYDHAAIPYRQSPVVRQRHLQAPTQTDQGSYDLDVIGTPLSDLANYGHNTAGSIPDTLHQGGAASYGVRYIGKAQRAGHEIPRPKAVKVGNQTPIEIANRFIQKRVASFFGVGVYAAAWVIDYALPSNPGRVRIPQDQSDK